MKAFVVNYTNHVAKKKTLIGASAEALWFTEPTDTTGHVHHFRNTGLADIAYVFYPSRRPVSSEFPKVVAPVQRRTEIYCKLSAPKQPAPSQVEVGNPFLPNKN